MATTAETIDFEALEREFEYVELLASYPEAIREKVDKFDRFARLCGVELEGFERLVMSEFFSGRRELICLLPRGNGKTTLLALVALYVMLTVKRGGVYVAAATAKQSKILFDEAKRLARQNASIWRRVKPRHNYLACEKTDAKLVFLASDRGGKAHGLIDGVLFIADELHAHVGSDTYVAMRTAMGKVPGAQLVVISTAGMRLAGTLFELRREAAKNRVAASVGCLTQTLDVDERVSMLDWALPQDTDPSSVTALDLKRANPFSGVTVAFLKEQLDAPGLRAEEVCCFHGNVWARIAKSWLKAGAWAACFEEGASIPLGAKNVWLCLDIGVYQDSSAKVRLWRREDGRVVVEARIWTPVGDGTPLDLTEVRESVREDRRDYGVDCLVFDRWNMELMAQEFDAEGLLVIDAPMRDMPSASKLIFEAINTREVVHAGDPELAAHVAAGRTVHTSSGWKLTKASRNVEDQIDAVIALAIGFRPFKLNGGTTRASTGFWTG